MDGFVEHWKIYKGSNQHQGLSQVVFKSLYLPAHPSSNPEEVRGLQIDLDFVHQLSQKKKNLIIHFKLQEINA